VLRREVIDLLLEVQCLWKNQLSYQFCETIFLNSVAKPEAVRFA
jgi:hypothetical protein